MYGITDVHAHILPGVDDGAQDWEEARWMLNCAFRQGIRTMVATPHYSRRQDSGRILERFKRLQEEAFRIDREFRIYLGQEFLYFDSLDEALKEGKGFTMAGSRCVLVEFLPEVSYGRLYQAVRKLLMAGYIPVVAHVERYAALRENGRMDELRETGCFLQMNYRSLEGGLLDRDARWCRRMVLDGRIDVLGTDAHHREYRTPDISGSMKWLENHVESRELRALAGERAGKLITGNSHTT